MWQVIFPLIKPSLLVASLWTALLTFREVSMALFLTGSRNTVLAVAVWDLWRTGDLGVASASAVMMVIIMGFLVLLTLIATGGRFTQT